jgi:hypothetical protein
MLPVPRSRTVQHSTFSEMVAAHKAVALLQDVRRGGLTLLVVRYVAPGAPHAVA